MHPTDIEREHHRETLKTILASCVNSTEQTGRVIFPEHFKREPSPLHKQILDLIDDPTKKKVVIAAPRGLGKTTTMSIGLCGRKILFGSPNRPQFIMYVSNSATAAEFQTETLKRELISNNFVRRYFPSIKPDKADDVILDFSRLAWVASNHTMIMPRGVGQQIRGLKWGPTRPTLIVIDDLENTEAVRNEESRKKLKEWFFADLMEAVSQFEGDDDYKIVYIDTLKHEDSLLAKLLEMSKDPEKTGWHGLRLSICDAEYNSNAPTFKSTKRIHQMVEAARQAGTLGEFYREHMSEPIALEDRTFDPKYFKHYREEDEKLNDVPDIENFVIVDPAKTATKTSMPSAIVGVGVNLRTNTVFVRDIVNARIEMHELIDQAIGMCERLRARVLCVESTGLEQWVEQPFKNEISRRNMHLHFLPLSAKRGKGELGYEEGKVGRIAALAPYYRQGLIKHNETCCAELELQLRSYPRSKHWDVMDALAYFPFILEKGERYFWPQRAMEAGDFDIESEYADLERDEWVEELELPDVSEAAIDLDMGYF